MNISLSRKKSRTVRLRGLAVLIVAGAVVCAAGLLLPNPAGYATHLQMGLPSCGYLARTGYPCPGCGVTTSLAAMARGQLGLAWSAQPFGVAVFLAVVAAGLAGLGELLCGRNILGKIPPPRWWWLGLILTAWLGGWACKLLAGLARGEYPIGR